jgi:gamma-glutamylcyclotransferase (GGCT)/AIG2-like uncharacterized protein YtfP
MPPELVFFYGTLMTPFHRTARLRIDQHLAYRGSGTIEAALFDLGIYPAAVPVTGERVHGELYEMRHPTIVLPALDELEGYRPGHPEKSLYTRTRTRVRLDDGSEAIAWAYFYNAPLGRAERIESGNYLQYLTRPLLRA